MTKQETEDEIAVYKYGSRVLGAVCLALLIAIYFLCASNYAMQKEAAMQAGRYDQLDKARQEDYQRQLDAERRTPQHAPQQTIVIPEGPASYYPQVWNSVECQMRMNGVCLQ